MVVEVAEDVLEIVVYVGQNFVHNTQIRRV